MTRRYTYEATLSWGGDEPTAELEVKVIYSVAWGSPESGRYSGPPEDYDPGSPDVVEDIKVLTVDGKHGPWETMDPTETLEQTIIAKLEMDHEEDMIREAIEAEEGREPDPYTEAKDRRMEDIR